MLKIRIKMIFEGLEKSERLELKSKLDEQQKSLGTYTKDARQRYGGFFGVFRRNSKPHVHAESQRNGEEIRRSLLNRGHSTALGRIPNETTFRVTGSQL